MKTVYIVWMRKDDDEWFDYNVYSNPNKADERLAELIVKQAAWEYEVITLNYYD